MYVPNASKLMEYALKKVKLDIASTDSSTASFNYLQLANALMQNGFFDEAMTYINKSLDYNPENPFGYVKVFVLYAKTHDLQETKELLLPIFNKDTTRIDILVQLANVYYAMKDYEAAYLYFKKFIEMRDARQMDVFKNMDLAVAIVLFKMGFPEKSEAFVKSFKDFADHDATIYKQINLAMYYFHQNDVAQGFAHMRLFLKEDNYQYWVLLLAREPAVERVKDLPEFKEIMQKIEAKFWKKHDEIKESLEEKGLL